MYTFKLFHWIAPLAAGLSMLATTTPAMAEWPERPITFVVPSAAGARPTCSRACSPMNLRRF